MSQVDVNGVVAPFLGVEDEMLERHPVHCSMIPLPGAVERGLARGMWGALVRGLAVQP